MDVQIEDRGSTPHAPLTSRVRSQGQRCYDAAISLPMQWATMHAAGMSDTPQPVLRRRHIQ
eukprot:3641364-Pleurochrysis_carterae.AAC.2